MIKITQDAVSQNFNVSVALETIRETQTVANRISRLLGKHGMTTVCVAKNDVSVELATFDNNVNVTVDNVLWFLVDEFNVGLGYWDYLGVYVESCNNIVSVTTNKDGSSVELCHKNAYKLRQDSEFPYTFAGGLQYFQVWRDNVRIDFPSSHVSALQIAQELLDFLDSLD